MKGYLVMIALFTVLNSAVNLVIWRDLSISGPMEVQAPVPLEDMRAMVHEELWRNRCYTVLMIGKKVPWSDIDKACYGDYLHAQYSQ